MAEPEEQASGTPCEGEPGEWRYNYFNYFTEIEEHFQRTRGTGLFLVSPLDWALIETWKESGVPLAAVLRGIDEAFAKWRSRKSKVQAINSLAYCAQAVLTAAQAMAGVAPAGPASKTISAPFEMEEIKSYLEGNAAALRRPGDPVYDEIASVLDGLAADVEAQASDLQQLDQRLTALEEKMLAVLRSRQDDEELFRARRELDRQLGPYRGKMTAEQIMLLEKKYLDQRLLDAAQLPRLSLFYIH